MLYDSRKHLHITFAIVANGERIFFQGKCWKNNNLFAYQLRCVCVYVSESCKYNFPKSFLQQQKLVNSTITVCVCVCVWVAAGFIRGVCFARITDP